VAARAADLVDVRRLLLSLVALFIVSAGSTLAAQESRPADLSLTGRDRPDPVTAGKRLTYTVLVRNRGPNEAKGVRLSGEVGRTGASTRRVLVLLSLKGKNCRKLATGSSPVISFACALRTMPAHTRLIVTMVVRPKAAGPFRLAAFVSSATRFHPSTLGGRSVEVRTTVRR
jgi:Domain of unknown function DUF11